MGACRTCTHEPSRQQRLRASTARRWSPGERGRAYVDSTRCVVQVEPALPEAVVLGLWDELPPDAALVVRAPGQADELRVALVPPPGQALRWGLKRGTGAGRVDAPCTLLPLLQTPKTTGQMRCLAMRPALPCMHAHHAA